jgi:S-DNA-T family DNA segregation ATPase FtsK/SpoIIIE
MSPKIKNSKNGEEIIKIKKETKDGIIAISLFLLTILSMLASFDKAGMVGRFLFDYLSKLLGVGYYLIPIASLILGISFIKNIEDRRFPLHRLLGTLIFFFAGLGIIDIVFGNGGIIGKYISSPMMKLFDFYAGITILCALLIASVLIIFESRLTFKPILAIGNFIKDIIFSVFSIFKAKENPIEQKEIKIKKKIENEDESENNDNEEEVEEIIDTSEKKIEKPIKIALPEEEKADFEGAYKNVFKSFGKEYVPPPLSLLERDSGKPIAGDIKASANIIKRTLQNFGITVEMDEVSIGPSVTRYALKPAEGVKLSKIAALQDNLAYALAAHPIRIEAPIPGKSLVGIEVPNSTKSTVGLATMFSSEEYQSSDKPLLCSLGKTISGKSQFGNLAKMPHLLIAGATGSGKSVTIHTIIDSLLFRNSPNNLKLIMIDPKRVELTLYNKIPHLLTPVITEAKKAILALKWAAKEMDRRYELLENFTVRDIESYHKNILAPYLKEKKDKEGEEDKNAPGLMPYIVIIIDELADIMTTYPRELEAAIVRLAQMSRAVGIHLILSTQRPSVNVITGLIKANVPARIALQVASQIDSRTILDAGGAEKLLGAGDMLYLGGDMSKPVRIQSAYVSETEVKKVVKYLKDTYADEIPSEITFSGDVATSDNGKTIFDEAMSDDEEVDDDLYESAREEVLKAGKASTSYIQRRLRVGYSRAARLIDMLEQKGVIGPADGAKPREVIDATAGAPTENYPEETQDGTGH